MAFVNTDFHVNAFVIFLRVQDWEDVLLFVCVCGGGPHGVYNKGKSIVNFVSSTGAVMNEIDLVL